MIKLADCNKITQWVLKIAALITAIGVCAGAAAWAGNHQWHTITAQAEYVQAVADEKRSSEVRQLKRDIKRLQLKIDNGTASAEDRAFVEYLKQDLEELQPPT